MLMLHVLQNSIKGNKSTLQDPKYLLGESVIYQKHAL